VGAIATRGLDARRSINSLNVEAYSLGLAATWAGAPQSHLIEPYAQPGVLVQP